MNYYNDNDPFIAKWLKALIEEDLIPWGFVDDRSITEVKSRWLRQYDQCHFFAGIAGWPRALELAGWNPARPVWTASLPCQPLSCAGQQRGEKDERHLWPTFYALVKECRPPIILGEQVSSKSGREWLAGIQADLETLGYIGAAADLPAASVGAPHKRNRLFWVGIANGTGSFEGQQAAQGARYWDTVEPTGGDGRLADSEHTERREKSKRRNDNYGDDAGRQEKTGRSSMGGKAGVFWSNSTFIPCADGKWRRVPCGVGDTKCNGLHGEQGVEGSEKERRVCEFERPGDGEHQPEIEPTLFPLADGLPGRVGLLRGAGNSIVPQVAAEFIKAVMEILDIKS